MLSLKIRFQNWVGEASLLDLTNSPSLLLPCHPLACSAGWCHPGSCPPEYKKNNSTAGVKSCATDLWKDNFTLKYYIYKFGYLIHLGLQVNQLWNKFHKISYDSQLMDRIPFTISGGKTLQHTYTITNPTVWSECHYLCLFLGLMLCIMIHVTSSSNEKDTGEISDEAKLSAGSFMRHITCLNTASVDLAVSFYSMYLEFIVMGK